MEVDVDTLAKARAIVGQLRVREWIDKCSAQKPHLTSSSQAITLGSPSNLQHLYLIVSSLCQRTIASAHPRRLSNANLNMSEFSGA